MKTAASTIILFFLVLFTYSKLAGPIPFSLTSVTTQKTDTFTVMGEGKMNIKPDIAVFYAGVESRGATVKIAQDSLNVRINDVAAAVKAQGVSEKDIQTSNYSISATYDYQSGTQRITGYQAHSSLTIKVRNLEHVNSVIDASTGAGANQVGGISFDIDDRTKAEDEARKLAVADAKKKAEMAAKTAGFTLGSIVNYSEGSTPPPQMVRMALEAKDSGPSQPTQIESGTNEIAMQVSLSYEIR